MTRRARLQRRPVLLAVSASLGVVGGHVLDAKGLLPGVYESAAVRAAALAPSFTVMTVVGAAALALGVDALLRRPRRWLAVVVLVAGQTALLGIPEVFAELTAGGGAKPAGGEAAELLAVGVAVALQVLLAVATVGVAVLVDTVLLRLPQHLQLLRIPAFPRPVTEVVQLHARRAVGGVRGRGPPVPVIP